MSGRDRLSRRSLLGLGMGTAVGVIGDRLLGGLSPDPRCADTPDQTEGPFYPIRDRADEDADLTYVEGRPGKAKGQVIYVEGRVTDEECEPVAGALVEIWQANTWGRYSHKEDPNPAPLDPNFQGWGQTATDEEGRYAFKSVKPGPYPVNDEWTRTPHIHFKVGKRGFHELTTQMYFEGEELNAEDRILQGLAPEEQERVSCAAQEPPADAEPGNQLYTFDIALRRVS